MPPSGLGLPPSPGFILSAQQFLLTFHLRLVRISSRLAYATWTLRLARRCLLFSDYSNRRPVLSPPLEPQHRRLFRRRTRRDLVARRHFDGGDHFRRRHAARRHRPRLSQWHRRQLALVELAALGDDDRFSLRAPLGALRPAHRRPIRRNALFWQARRVSARLPRDLSGHAHQLS